MSKPWSTRLLDALRRLGVQVDANAEAAIQAERDRDPTASTEDIVQRLSLAPDDVIAEAAQVAKRRDGDALMRERIESAKLALGAAGAAAGGLASTARAVASLPPGTRSSEPPSDLPGEGA